MNKYYVLIFIIFLIIYSYAIMEPTNSRTYNSGTNVVVNNYPQTSSYYDDQYEILRRNLI